MLRTAARGFGKSPEDVERVRKTFGNVARLGIPSHFWLVASNAPTGSQQVVSVNISSDAGGLGDLTLVLTIRGSRTSRTSASITLSGDGRVASLQTGVAANPAADARQLTQTSVRVPLSAAPQLFRSVSIPNFDSAASSPSVISVCIG